jgi:hypothetical protein
LHGASLLVLGSLIAFIPAQTQSQSAVPAARGPSGSKVVMERHTDACMGLDAAQCCAQMLEIAGFRATGDQLPRAAKTPLRLSCEVPEKVFPETSCRMLALARGFGAKDANELCAPATLAKRCQGDTTCKQCVADLDRMAWKSSHRACYAITYVERASNDGVKVVSITRGKASANGAVVRMRRTTLR